MRYAHSGLAGCLVGRLNPHGPFTPRETSKLTGPAKLARANFDLLRSRCKRPKVVDKDYVAEKLSGLPEAIGKEESHGHGRLPLRQVRLEGLSSTALPIPFDFGSLLAGAKVSEGCSGLEPLWEFLFVGR